MKNIALINDQPILRHGLTMIIKETFNQLLVRESGTFEQFLELYPGKNPDLILLSINCKAEKDCIDLAKRAKSQFPKAAIIAYIENLHPALIASYFKFGLQGVLSTQSTIDELIGSINTLMQGKPYLSQDLFFYMMPLFAENMGSFSEDEITSDTTKDLAKREKQIAQYLNQGMKSTQIATKLGLQPSTVSTIKKNIFRKMNIHNVFELRQILESQSYTSV